MLASFFQSLASTKETEKQRFRKLLSHVGERVHVIAIRSEVSSPNRLYVQDRFNRQQQQQNENPQQQSPELVEVNQQQQRRTTRSGRNNSNGSFSNNDNNNNGDFMMQRVQSELREEDEREFDFIDESEIELEEEEEEQQQQQTVSNNNNNNNNNNNSNHPDNEALNLGNDEEGDDDNLDPQVRIRKFELRGYLAFVDAKNILIFDTCPPDSKEFKKRLDSLLPEHKEFLQSFPLCTTVKIESIVSITEDSKVKEEKESDDEKINLPSKKTKKQKLNNNNRQAANRRKTELDEMQSRNANFARLMSSTMSGDILCQALLLRFVWERICLEDQKEKFLLGKTNRNIVATTGTSSNLRTTSSGGAAEIPEETSSALQAIRLRRRQLIQQLIENRRQQQQHASASSGANAAATAATATAIDSTTINNNSSNQLHTGNTIHLALTPSSPSNNPNRSESNNSFAALHQLPSGNNEKPKQDEKNEKVADDEDDRNSDDNPSFHEDDHEHPSRRVSASTGRSPTNVSLPVDDPQTVNRNANDDDDDDNHEHEQASNPNNHPQHSLHPAPSIRQQFGFNLESDEDDDDIDDDDDDLANDDGALQSLPANTNLADCDIMSSRNGDSNTHSALSRFISRTVSNGSEGEEPEYAAIINRRFPHLQHFIGEQLIRMKLADEESEVPATFQLLEHAGRKFGGDFGFELCIAQARHLRKLNEMIEAGQATSAGSTFASLFGLGSNGSRVNFFDMDEGQPLRDFLRGRLGANGGRAGSGDTDHSTMHEVFRRHLFDDLINSNFYFGPQRSLYRVRFGFWCIMLLVFIACTTLLYVKSVQQFVFVEWVVHRSLVDLAVLLMLPATSTLIICVGLIGNISVIATKKSFVLPNFERYKLLRFLVNLAVVITFITIGLKFKSASDAESVEGAIATIALRDNSTMCYYQILHNCSGGSKPCDRNAFLYGNNTQNCPSNCDYPGTIFKGIPDVASWWSPTQGCTSFVERDIFTELVFSSVTCAVLFAMNLVWGCTESTCFDQFNRR